MKTRTRRPGLLFTAPLNHLSASARSSGSAFRVTKSVSGLPGTARGHCTSPTWRAPAGGIDTVMLAKVGLASPRSPLNSSPAGALWRVVATSMSTLVVPAVPAATGRRTPLGVPAQAARTVAIVRLAETIRMRRVADATRSDMEKRPGSQSKRSNASSAAKLDHGALFRNGKLVPTIRSRPKECQSGTAMS